MFMFLCIVGVVSMYACLYLCDCKFRLTYTWRPATDIRLFLEFSPSGLYSEIEYLVNPRTQQFD